jgi:hypothetical protein
LLLGSRVDHCAGGAAARRFLPMSCRAPPRCHIAGRPSKRMGGSNGGACRAFRTLALAAIGGGSQNLSCLRQFEGRSRISNCLAQMLAPVRRQSER